MTSQKKCANESQLSLTQKPIHCEEKMHINVNCKYLGVEIPLSSINKYDSCISIELDDIFRRSGYVVEPINPFDCPIVNIAVNDIQIKVSRYCIGLEQEEIEISTELQNSVVSLMAPVSLDEISYQKFDLLSLESETQINPDAVIKITFSKVFLDNKTEVFKKRRAKTLFPSVVSLASVKSSQQFDHENTQSLKDMKRKLRGADPQIRMLQDTGSCESIIHISIPSVALDLTSDEKRILLDILSCFQKNGKSENNVHSSSNETRRMAFSINCNQLSISMHHDFDKPEIQNETIYSQLIVFDGLCFHCLLGGEELKHVRFLSHDVTLHEGKHSRSLFHLQRFVSITNVVFPEYPFPWINKVRSVFEKQKKKIFSISSVREMRDIVRRRFDHHSSLMQSSVVFCRSKLSHPLCPTTPALHIDMLVNRQQEDDIDDIEKSLHINIYDLTHRPDLESNWLNRFKTWCQSNDADEGKQQMENTIVLNVRIDLLFLDLTCCSFHSHCPYPFNAIMSK